MAPLTQRHPGILVSTRTLSKDAVSSGFTKSIPAIRVGPSPTTIRPAFRADARMPAMRGQTDFAASGTPMDVIERIKTTLAEHPVVLYMKGTPQFPMCGFSMRTSQALNSVGAEYFSVNVLEDPEIRANLPRYSNWPTFPQLYINGELIGGCDITLELYESGELQRMVADAGKQTTGR
jgi:monothiol glutaredoxin